MRDFDDKDLVIFSVLLICLAVIVTNALGTPIDATTEKIVEIGFSGMFGIAVGRVLSGNGKAKADVEGKVKPAQEPLKVTKGSEPMTLEQAKGKGIDYQENTLAS